MNISNIEIPKLKKTTNNNNKMDRVSFFSLITSSSNLLKHYVNYVLIIHVHFGWSRVFLQASSIKKKSASSYIHSFSFCIRFEDLFKFSSWLRDFPQTLLVFFSLLIWMAFIYLDFEIHYVLRRVLDPNSQCICLV